MNIAKNIFFALSMALTLSACNNNEENNTSASSANRNANVINNQHTIGNTTLPVEIMRLEFPKIKGGNSMIVVNKTTLNSKTGEYGVNYSVEWDTQKKSQRWSCYQMYASISASNTKRYESETNQYPKDPTIPNDFQFASDPYWSTGYDHGHICPSSDRLGSYDANKQTFYLSNMQPQLNSFNAQVWANMENQLRTWNRNDFRDTLYVVKGGTIDNETQIIKRLGSGLIVPKYFYMAILCKNKMGYKALGFWIEHQPNDDTQLGKYVVNIKQLERLTNIDFFCNLPDEIENNVESLPVENIKRAWGLQ